MTTGKTEPLSKEEVPARFEQWSWKAAAHFMRYFDSPDPIERERALAASFLGAMARGITEGYQFYRENPNAPEEIRAEFLEKARMAKKAVQESKAHEPM